jgi:hypothetical protein
MALADIDTTYRETIPLKVQRNPRVAERRMTLTGLHISSGIREGTTPSRVLARPFRTSLPSSLEARGSRLGGIPNSGNYLRQTSEILEHFLKLKGPSSSWERARVKKSTYEGVDLLT